MFYGFPGSRTKLGSEKNRLAIIPRTKTLQKIYDNKMERVRNFHIGEHEKRMGKGNSHYAVYIL